MHDYVKDPLDERLQRSRLQEPLAFWSSIALFAVAAGILIYAGYLTANFDPGDLTRAVLP